MSKYEIDVWEYADEFKNLDTNETFYGYQVCELLEHKDQQISDLETKLVEEKEYTQQYRKECAKIQTDYYKTKQQLEDLTKKYELASCPTGGLVDRVRNLEQQLATAEKALELACKELHCELENPDNELYIKSSDEYIDYFKTRAKEMMKSE